ncbi:MAG: hypothetical protein H6813_02590 [Phycisphaeraceae bacterium]|nr:hypothetical protein [Phycisphaeraceae bacterium]MCB9848796.1 hypothetical protein [Phycisphaeraceae bacterium]
MQQFTDNEGRSWTVEVNVAALKRAKGLAGVDLMGVLDGDLIERFIRDPVLLCDALYAVCKPEVDARSVTDEDFGRAMAGDAIEQATEALLDEIVSFCPSPRDRSALGRVLAATRTAMDRARDLVEARLDSGELEKAIDAALEQATPGASSTTAPASVGSTPPP